MKDKGAYKRCPHCGKMHRSDARFCSRTGKTLPGSVEEPESDSLKTRSVQIITAHCPKCGEILASGRKARFCNHCGFELVNYRFTKKDPLPVSCSANRHSCPYPDCENPIALGSRYCPVCYRRVRFCEKCSRYLVTPVEKCPDCDLELGPDPGNWPMFKGNHNRTGNSVDNMKTDLELCWSYPDRKKAEPILSSPVVYNGVVYYGSCDTHLHALNQYNGEIIWKKPTNGNILSTPAIMNGVIYVASCDGKIYAHEAMNGKPVWVYPSGREKSLGDITAPLLACPAGVVAVCDSGLVLCLDHATGILKWKVMLQDQDTEEIRLETTGLAPGAAFDDWKIFIPGKNGKVYCHDANDGSLVWSFPAEGPVESSFVSTPSVAAGHCYVPDRSGKFYSIDQEKGIDSWQFTVDLDGVVEGSPSVGFGSVVVGTGTQYLVALNMHAGGEVWRRKNERIRLVDSIFSTPVITLNKLIFVGSNSGYVYCRDLESGEEIWKYRLESPIRSSPVISDGFLYVTTAGGILYAFRRR